MNQTESVETLVLAASKDAGAFTELVFRHQNLALGTALTLLKDRHMAQDVVQESFLTAYQRLGTLREPKMFPGWLRGIVRHCCHRVLRKARSTVSLQQVELIGEENPVSDLEQQEMQGATRSAIADLPSKLQEVVYLYYLQDQSQAAVARYLNESVSTVNNRLHRARQTLKRTLKMVVDQVKDESLSRDFAEQIGQVLSVTGTMIEAQLKVETGEVFEAMSVTGHGGQLGATLRVVQRLGGGKVRCQLIAPKDELRPGMDLVSKKEGIHTRLPEGDFDSVLAELSGESSDSLFETGIKPLDFFSPVSQGGLLGFFGTQGVGRIVLERELYHRFAGGAHPLTIVYFAQNGEAGLIQRLLTSDFENHTIDVEGVLQTVWLLSQDATDPGFLQGLKGLDSGLYFDPLLAFHGLYPALDPLRSRSRLVEDGHISARHQALREDVIRELRWKKDLLADTELLEHALRRSVKAFRRRFSELFEETMKGLTERDRARLSRARNLERFFTNPFYVAKEFNGIEGEHVSLDETLSGVQAILEGRWDAVSEEELLYKGALPARP